MVSTINLPPNELSDFGRLNFMMPICPITSKTISLYLLDDMFVSLTGVRVTAAKVARIAAFKRYGQGCPWVFDGFSG